MPIPAPTAAISTPILRNSLEYAVRAMSVISSCQSYHSEWNCAIESRRSLALGCTAALGTGTVQLRPALMKLKSQGAVEPKGKARATRYYAVAG
jgi:hypothetical protein